MPRHAIVTIPITELRALYEGGWSTVALAEHYGCSPATINKRLREAGVALRSARYRPAPLDETALRRLYLEERLTIAAIAAHFGVSPSTVGNRRRAYGIPPRKRSRRRIAERRIKYQVQRRHLRTIICT
jgi:transposase-like protein